MIYKYCLKIQEILKNAIPASEISYYLIGSGIGNIPKEVAEKGFIWIRPVTSSTINADTQRDTISGVIEVIVGVASREFIQEQDYEQADLIKTIDIMEGVDENGNMRQDTVCYALRSNINNTWLGQSEFTIDYDSQIENNAISAIKLTITVVDMRNRYNL